MRDKLVILVSGYCYAEMVGGLCIMVSLTADDYDSRCARKNAAKIDA